MPSNSVVVPVQPDQEAERRPALASPADGFRIVLTVLSPALAAAVSLLIHQFVPNRQFLPSDSLQAWLHWYPDLLIAFFGIAILLAAAQWVFQPLRLWVRHNAPLQAGAILLLGLWDLVTLKLNWMVLPYFPGPSRVFASMVRDKDILMESAYCSLLLLLSGYLTGVTAGLVTGVLIGWYPRVRYWGMPLLKVIGPVPATALIPLAMHLSSESFIPATALIGFAVWFPMTMLTSSGIANVRLSYLDVARTLGAGEGYLIFRVALPSALPYIFIGLFMGLGVSFLTLIVAETVGVQAGLGHYFQTQQGSMVYANMYGGLIIMAAFFSGMMTLLFKLRDWMLKWQKGVIKW